MKKNLLLFLLLYFLIMPVMAEDWTLIPNTNVSYDKDSIEYGDYGVVRIMTKNPVDNVYETRTKLSINCNTQRFNYFEAKLYDTYKRKYVYRDFSNSNWQDIPQNSNLRYLYNDVCHK